MLFSKRSNLFPPDNLYKTAASLSSVPGQQYTTIQLLQLVSEMKLVLELSLVVALCTLMAAASPIGRINKGFLMYTRHWVKLNIDIETSVSK